MRSRKDSPSAPYLWAQAIFDILDRTPPETLAAEMAADIAALWPGSFAALAAEKLSHTLVQEDDHSVGRAECSELIALLRKHDEDEAAPFIRLANLIRALLGSQATTVDVACDIARLDPREEDLGLDLGPSEICKAMVGWLKLGANDLGSDSLASSLDWPAVARDLGHDFVKPLSEGERLITRRALVEKIRAQGFEKVAAEVEAACRTVASKGIAEWRREVQKSGADEARANRERAERALAGELHEGDSDELWLSSALAEKPPAIADLVEALDGLVHLMFPNTKASEHADAALRASLDNSGNICTTVLAMLAEVPDFDVGPVSALGMLAVLIAARLGDKQSAASLSRELRSVSDHVKGDDALRGRMRAISEAWRILSADPEAALAEETDLGDAAIRIAGETRRPGSSSSSNADDDEFWLTAALDPEPTSIKYLVEALARRVVKSMPDTEAARWADAASDAVHVNDPPHGEVRRIVKMILEETEGLRTADEGAYWLAHLVCAKLGRTDSAADLAGELVRRSREVRDRDFDAANKRMRLHQVAHGWLVLSADPSAAGLGTTDRGKAALEAGYGFVEMIEHNALRRLDEARKKTAEKKASEPETMVVLRAVAAAPKNHGRGAASSSADYGDFDNLILRPLPLVRVPDLAAVQAELTAEFPHAEGLIESVLSDLVGRKSIRLRPTLLLGPPGGGKSRLARRLCEALALPYLLYPSAGQADSAFAGTARRWSSAEPSLPLRLIRDREVANPALLLDELEKAGTSRHNGNLWDVLISMIERETAQRWEDPYVQSPVDLSAIQWLATANSLEGLPTPLLDRLRVLRMPSPGPEHLPVLAASLLRALARERGLDVRWLSPLAGYELEGLQSNWKSGSIRALRRLLEGVLNARDQAAPRN